MNTTASKIPAFIAVALTVAIGATAALASFDIGSTAEARPEIVKLERVVITAKRAETSMAATQVARIEQLPRVVIEGRRAVDAPVAMQLASAKGCNAAVC